MAIKIKEEFTSANNDLAETNNPPVPARISAFNNKYAKKNRYALGITTDRRSEYRNAHGKISELNNTRAGVILGKNTK
jgi:hypothetical protein